MARRGEDCVARSA